MRNRCAPTPKLGKPLVEQRAVLQSDPEGLSGEMGPAPRAGIATNIGHRLNSICGEELEKLLKGSRRMPDGPYAHWHPDASSNRGVCPTACARLEALASCMRLSTAAANKAKPSNTSRTPR